MPLRVAAISFLNPAPLLYDFEHAPAAEKLRARYAVHYTLPSRCAAELHAGEADLGLIPIAELTPELRVVPGCTIASQGEVRSILLLVRIRENGTEADALRSLTTIAADSASRSSAAYLRVILGRFYGVHPTLVEHPADPLRMLADFPAALLIGDPALLARERRAAIDAAVAASGGDRLLWLDIAQLWRRHTGLPWVAAVWAVRPEALEGGPRTALGDGQPTALEGGQPTAREVIEDLNASRKAGLAHIEELVAEWTPRLPLSPETIRIYLTHNISYALDPPCLKAVRLFRTYAAELGVLPPLPELHLLAP